MPDSISSVILGSSTLRMFKGVNTFDMDVQNGNGDKSVDLETSFPASTSDDSDAPVAKSPRMKEKRDKGRADWADWNISDDEDAFDYDWDD